MTMADTRDPELRRKLAAWADGDRGAMAAVRLLCEHGIWPEHLRSAGYMKGGQDDDEYARPLLVELVEQFDAHTDRLLWSPSSSEMAVLRIAASLAARVPVDLGSELLRLDRRNRALVVGVLADL